MSVLSFSHIAMARLSATLKVRPQEASNAEMIALAEYSARLSQSDRIVLARITNRIVEIEREEGPEAALRHLGQMQSILDSSGRPNA